MELTKELLQVVSEFDTCFPLPDLSERFKFTGRTLYSSRVEIETPYLYVNGDFIHLYLTNHDGKYLISDYGDFSIKYESLLDCIQDVEKHVINRLNADKIGYSARIQNETIELENIEHVVLNDEELSVHLVKIAKTLSELSNEITCKN